MCFFFFNDTATTEIYTLSLHDALPICRVGQSTQRVGGGEKEAADEGRACASPAQCAPAQFLCDPRSGLRAAADRADSERSEEHTSELQSRQYLVCRLLLEKKKNNTYKY